MFNIMICDDNIEIVNQIKNVLREYLEKSSFGDFSFRFLTFENSENAVQSCQNERIDVAFLDIDMPRVNGFDIASLLKDTGDAVVVFVSSFDHLVYTSLRFKPLRFVRKKYLADEITEAMSAAMTEILARSGFLMLDAKHENERVLYRDILYVEGNGNYVNLVLQNAVYKYRATMISMAEQLRAYDFLQCHKAYLVNARWIKAVMNEEIILQNGKKIRISRNYKPAFQTGYAQYMLK